VNKIIRNETVQHIRIRHDVASILLGYRASFIADIFDQYNLLLIVGSKALEMRSAILLDTSEDPQIDLAREYIALTINRQLILNEVRS